jgi:hypothetical protein
MGRRRWTTRLLVESCAHISVAALASAGVFRLPTGTEFTGTLDGSVFRIYLEGQRWQRLIITSLCNGSVREDSTQSFGLSATLCHFGGYRYWLGCQCGRRVGMIHLRPDEKRFGCRTCLDLQYRSSRTHNSRIDKLARLPLGNLIDMVKDRELSVLDLVRVTRKVQARCKGTRNSV